MKGMDFFASPLYWILDFFGYDLTFFTGEQRVKLKYLLWTEYIKYYFFCDVKYFLFYTLLCCFILHFLYYAVLYYALTFYKIKYW